jgi:Flp pilus assembly protein TadD
MSIRLVSLSLFILLLSSTHIARSQQVHWPGSSSTSNTSTVFGKGSPESAPNLSSMMGQVLGVVTAPDSSPVPYAMISMSGTNGPPVSITSDEDGRFEIHQVPYGHYDLSASVGLREGHSGVDVGEGVNLVTLTIPENAGSKSDGQSTVSTAQLAVPSKARRELEKAEDSVRRSKWAEATDHIEKALTFWPRYAEAFILRSIIELEQGSAMVAKADAEKAIGFDPGNAKAYVVLGSSYNRLERWDDALRTLDRGIAIAPSYWPGHYEMSKALLGKGDFAGALRQAENATIPVTANYAPLHIVKGYAYLGLGNQAAASEELETSLKLHPTEEVTAKVKKTLDRLHACSVQKQDCAKNNRE